LLALFSTLIFFNHLTLFLLIRQELELEARTDLHQFDPLLGFSVLFRPCVQGGEVLSDRGEVAEIYTLLFEQFGEGLIDASFADDDFVVSKVDNFFVGTIGEANDTFETLSLYFLRVDGWEHLLDGLADHPHLCGVSESAHDGEWIFEAEAERLASFFEHVFHAAIVDYSKSHLATSQLDYSQEIF
jgi:hypothetical protein